MMIFYQKALRFPVISGLSNTKLHCSSANNCCQYSMQPYLLVPNNNRYKHSATLVKSTAMAKRQYFFATISRKCFYCLAHIKLDSINIIRSMFSANLRRQECQGCMYTVRHSKMGKHDLK